MIIKKIVYDNMKTLDNIATEMIPIRLLISVIVIGAVISMIALGYINFNIIHAENIVTNDCASLESKLLTMVGSGISRDVNDINAPEGTKRTHTFNLPANLNYISFGVDPDSNNNGLLTSGLTNNGSVIFYQISGGNKKVIWYETIKFRFREGKYSEGKWMLNTPHQGFIIDDSGKAVIVFELVQNNKEKYILIQANDGI